MRECERVGGPGSLSFVLIGVRRLSKFQADDLHPQWQCLRLDIAAINSARDVWQVRLFTGLYNSNRDSL